MFRSVPFRYILLYSVLLFYSTLLYSTLLYSTLLTLLFSNLLYSILYSMTSPSITDWRPWGSWSSCSVSCGRGTVSRRRHCHSDVGECVGESSQTEACAMPQCPRKSGSANFLNSSHTVAYSPFLHCLLVSSLEINDIGKTGNQNLPDLEVRVVLVTVFQTLILVSLEPADNAKMVNNPNACRAYEKCQHLRILDV